VSIRTPHWRYRAATSAVAVAVAIGTAFAAPAAAGGGHDEHPKGGPPGQAGRTEQSAVATSPQGPSSAAPEPGGPSGTRPATPPAVAAPTAKTEATASAPETGAAPAAAQGEAPGNRGTVKVHRTSTPDSDRRNEPKLCAFRIVGFGFPDDADLSITIEGHGGPNAGADSFSTSLTADQLSDAGDFGIAGPTLADGMYKLYVENTTAPGGAKQKVFKIDCGETGVDDDTDVDSDTDVDTDLDSDLDSDSDVEGTGTDTEVGGTSTGSGTVTEVLGLQVQRSTAGTPAAGSADAAVMAASASGAQVASGLLARTGAEALVIVLVGLALLALGTLLVRRSRVGTMR